MNHRTPAEERLAAQLAAAPGLTALARVHLHLFGQDGTCAECDTDIVTWSQAQGDAELDHIAIEGTRS